jgi:hypothetical protein
MQHRADAHRARLERDVQVAVGQPVVARDLRGLAQCDDLGVRRGIVAADRLVEAGAAFCACWSAACMNIWSLRSIDMRVSDRARRGVVE